MRRLLASALMYFAYVLGLCSAGGWAWLSWGFDFGTSGRGRGLWLLSLAVGTPIAFLVGLFAVVAIHSKFFPEENG